MEDSIIGLFYLLICCVYIFFEIIVSLVIIGLLVFWIIMLINAVKKDYNNENDKIMWLLILLFTGVIGAFVYYFVEYRKKIIKTDSEERKGKK